MKSHGIHGVQASALRCDDDSVKHPFSLSRPKAGRKQEAENALRLAMWIEKRMRLIARIKKRVKQ